MTDGPLARDGVVARWTALIGGEADREEIHEWANAQRTKAEPDDPMVGDGLSYLSGFNIRMEAGNPLGIENPHSVGDYIRTVEAIAESLTDWLALCARYDADPQAWHKHEYRLRLRLPDGSEKDGGVFLSSEAYALGDTINVGVAPEGRSLEGRGYIWRVAAVSEEGELILEFVMPHLEQPTDWPLPPG